MKKFYLCKLCLIVFGALLAVQSVSAGNWNKSNDLNPESSELKLVPGLWPFNFMTAKEAREQFQIINDTNLGQILKFELRHGQCSGDGNFNDCDNDRQRIMLRTPEESQFSIKNVDLNARRSDQNVRIFEFGMMVPNDDRFFKTSREVYTSQILVKARPYISGSDLWFLKIDEHSGGLVLKTRAGRSCSIPGELWSRGSWYDFKVQTDFSIYSKSEIQDLMKSAKLARQGKKPLMEPALRITINGETACEIFSPIFTEKIKKQVKENKVYAEYGLYNAWVSVWLASQPENQAWLRQNNIELQRYVQDGSYGISTPTGTPFKYDWPVKLPTQTVFFTPMIITKPY